jgi:hypothetical protein
VTVTSHLPLLRTVPAPRFTTIPKPTLQVQTALKIARNAGEWPFLRFAFSRGRGVRPLTQELAEGADPVAFVLDKNLMRHHLNESQRALVAAKLANRTHGGSRKSDQAAAWRFDSVSTEEAAEKMDVSTRSVQQARLGGDLARVEEIAEVCSHAAFVVARFAGRDPPACAAMENAIRDAIRPRDSRHEARYDRR